MTDHDTRSTSEPSLVNWIAQIHRHLALNECAAAITNETRLWSSWDRVSLLLKNGDDVRVASISGVTTIDPRSSTVQLLQAIAKKASESEATVSTAQDPLAEMKEYHERCAVSQVAILPIAQRRQNESNSALGVLICDLFEARENKPVRTVVDLKVIAPEIGQALANSLEFERTRMSRYRRFLSNGQSFNSLFAVLCLGGGVVALCFVQADLTVSGTGILNPQRRRDVFSPVDGLIESIAVDTGDQLKTGDTLMTLRSPALELKISELTGAIQTVRQQIGDLEKLRTGRGSSSTDRASSNDLAARREGLKSQEASLSQQLKLLNIQADELSLTSPIEGEVMTADVAEQLVANRPVRRTDRLLRIGDLSGPWSLELFVDQHDIGPVIAARESGREVVTFVTADSPESAKPAEIVNLAPNVEADPTYGVVLRVTAIVDREDIPHLSPGTHVQYRIQCGRASIGYVWFRQLIDKMSAWFALHVWS